MPTYLTYREEFLKANCGYWTAKDISQQPNIWRQATANVDANREHINQWLEPVLALQNLRIILTGAGTSTYVWASLSYLTYCQVLAFFKAINATLTPDNPCPTGEVNRVVQGVTIYPLEQP